MKSNKRQILEWLAGTDDPETLRVIQADLSDRERSEVLAWLGRMVGTANRLDKLAQSDDFERWLGNEDDENPDPKTLDVEAEIPRETATGMLVGERGSSQDEAMARPSGRWSLELPQDESGRSLARLIGERCYADPKQSVVMTLHFRSSAEGDQWLQAELEVSPPPTREPLTVVIEFQTGDRREFMIDVPVSPRRSTRSTSDMLVPRDAARIESGSWLDLNWPPTMKLS